MDPTEPFKKRFQERGQWMEPPVEAAPTEPVAEVGTPGEQVRGRLEVASEEASGYNGGGHHFRVGDDALRAFTVAASTEPNARRTVSRNDSGVHETKRLRERVWMLFPQSRSWAPLFSTHSLYLATWVR